VAGEGSGRAAFEGWLGSPFPIDAPGFDGFVRSERSPYGLALDVAYPRVTGGGSTL
jgi:hypothetical protein